MATWRVNSNNATIWASLTTYNVGEIVVSSVGNSTARKSRVYVCTSGGQSGGSEPAWNTTVDGTTTDATVTWTTKDPTDGTWGHAHYGLFWITSVAAAGDTILIHKTSAESASSSVSDLVIWGSSTFANPIYIYCVDKDNSDALATGATATTLNRTLHFWGTGYSYGVTYINSNNNIDMTYGTNSTDWILEGNNTTVLSLPDTGTDRHIYLGYDAGYTSRLKIINGNISFARLGSRISFNYHATGFFQWQGGAVVAPNGMTNLIDTDAGDGGSRNVLIEDVDLTAVGKGATATSLVKLTTNAYFDTIQFSRCKLPSDAGFVLTTNNLSKGCTGKTKFHHCTSANATYPFSEYMYEGLVTYSTSIYRSGGASYDSTTPWSWQMVSNANAVNRYRGLASPPIRMWVDASAHTYTLYGVLDSATNLQNGDLWLEMEYPANNTDGLGAIASTRVVPLATAADLTSDTSTWTGTGGFSNLNRFKVAVTVTPGKAGPATFRVFLAKASTTIYLDPLPVQS